MGVEELPPKPPGTHTDTSFCMTQVAKGMQERIMRLIDIGKSDRLMLFNPMFKAKVTDKPKTPAQAFGVFSGFGV